jgi:hypothetical protein
MVPAAPPLRTVTRAVEPAVSLANRPQKYLRVVASMLDVLAVYCERSLTSAS